MTASHHDLVFHVGMPRATSIVAPALRRLQPQLRARGVAYVAGTQLARLGQAAGWKRDRLTRHKARTAFNRQVATLARSEQQRAGSLWRTQVPVVIAGDELLGRGDIGRRDAEQLRPFASEAISQVIEALSARNVQIVLHTHRQDRLLEMAYLRQLRAGHHLGVEEYIDEVARPVLDYADLVDRLRRVPAVRDVVVRPVELADAGVHAFVENMLGHLGLSNTLDLYALGADLDPYPNVYSPRGAALARALNPLVSGDEFPALSRFLMDKHSAPSEYGAPDILPSDLRARILASYRELNQQLFSHYMPDLSPDSYTDEVATFNLGNVLSQPTAPEATATSRISNAAVEQINRASTALHRTVRRVRRLERPRRLG